MDGIFIPASEKPAHQQTMGPVPTPSHLIDQRWRVYRGCAHQVQSKIVRAARSRAATIQITIHFHFRSGSKLGDCSMAVMWDDPPDPAMPVIDFDPTRDERSSATVSATVGRQAGHPQPPTFLQFTDQSVVCAGAPTVWAPLVPTWPDGFFVPARWRD